MNARDIVRTRLPIVHFATFFLPRRKRNLALIATGFCCVIVDALGDPEESAKSDDAIANAPSALHVLSNTIGSGCPSSPRLTLLRQRVDEIYEARLDRAVKADDERQIIFDFADHLRDLIPKEYVTSLAEARVMRDEARFGATLALIAAAILGVTNSDARRAIESLGGAIWFTASGAKDERIASMFRSGATLLPWLGGVGPKLAAAIVVVAYERMFDGGADANRLTFVQRIALLPAAYRRLRARA